MINRDVVTDQIAQVCRSTYIWLRRFYCADSKYEPGPRWDGGVWNGKRYQNIWQKVARFVQQEGVHPVEWVKLHFSRMYRGDRVPYPTDLLDRSLLAEYKTNPRPDRAHIEAMWNTELRSAFHLIKRIQEDYQADHYGSCRILLALHRDEFSPLFAYILASVIGDEKSKEDLFMPAVLQLSEAPRDYLESGYGKHLPSEVVEYGKCISA